MNVLIRVEYTYAYVYTYVEIKGIRTCKYSRNNNVNTDQRKTRHMFPASVTIAVYITRGRITKSRF